jgi:hypothetical protein
LDQKSVYVLTDISLNILRACLRNNRLEAIKLGNLKLFDPIAQEHNRDKLLSQSTQSTSKIESSHGKEKRQETGNVAIVDRSYPAVNDAEQTQLERTNPRQRLKTLACGGLVWRWDARPRERQQKTEPGAALCCVDEEKGNIAG